MGRGKDPIKLAKVLAYALGRNPDEFGLVPNRYYLRWFVHF